MLSQAYRAQPGPTLPPLPAPRVCVHTAEQGQVIEPVAASEQADFREAFFRAFGTTDEVVAQALYEQILNALHAASGRPVDNDAANLALGLIREIAPGDAVEAMLACQWAGLMTRCNPETEHLENVLTKPSRRTPHVLHPSRGRPVEC